MIPWLIVGLAVAVAVAVAGWSGFLACRRKHAKQQGECIRRFLFLELHEAELSEARAVWMHVIDDRCFAVVEEFAERERERHRPPIYLWPELVAEISQLCTGSAHTPPLPGVTLELDGLESLWVVSVCEPQNQMRLIRQHREA